MGGLTRSGAYVVDANGRHHMVYRSITAPLNSETSRQRVDLASAVF